MDSMTYDPVHRSIVIVDIEGFCKPSRTNTARIRMREALYRMFNDVLRRASIAESQCTLKDQGDGILALVQPQVCKCRLIYPLIPHLDAALEAYNRNVGEEAQMRLRVAIHAGEVVRHSIDHVRDYVGEDLNHAFRLLASRVLRRQLAASDAPLVLIVSQLIYDGVVKHGYPGIDVPSYEQVRVTAKETKAASAWISIPHRAADPKDGMKYP